MANRSPAGLDAVIEFGADSWLGADLEFGALFAFTAGQAAGALESDAAHLRLLAERYLDPRSGSVFGLSLPEDE